MTTNNLKDDGIRECSSARAIIRYTLSGRKMKYLKEQKLIYAIGEEYFSGVSKINTYA